jgi:hypothetical protein
VTRKNNDDRVGYKRPPKQTRFKPGQSGNPKGRPKYSRNLKTEFLEELSELILVREGDRTRKISKQRAFVKALVNGAIKGDMRAATALVSLCTRTFSNEPEDARPPSRRPMISTFSTSSSVVKSGAAPPKTVRMVIHRRSQTTETKNER